MIIKINTKTELETYVIKALNEDVLDTNLVEVDENKIIKYYFHLFSLACRMFCKVHLDTVTKELIIFTVGKSGYIKSTTWPLPIHKNNTKFIPKEKHPAKIDFRIITSPKVNGKLFTFKADHKYVPVFIGYNGEMYLHPNQNIARSDNYINEIDTWLNNHNGLIVDIKAISDIYNEYFNNPNKCRKLDWDEAKNYGTYLALVDCIHIKRGMVITSGDFNRYGLGSGWNNNSPLEILKLDSVYSYDYRIACNLNLTTLEELQAITTDKYSCVKQSHGCQRGCTTSCNSVTANSIIKSKKDLWIKLFKEIFN